MDYKIDSDKWYKYKGVKPPERQSHGVTEDELDDKIAQNNDHICQFKQKGNYIFCTQGKNEHGYNIGVHRRLSGTTELGKPILVNI